jgi:hypothetical protein
LLASITGVLPDLAIKLIDHVRETEKIKQLKAEYLRNAYYRNKTIKNKRPKFLKYITIPSFSNLTSLTHSNNNNNTNNNGNDGQNGHRGNGNSNTPKEKNKLTTYLKQISTTSKASMTNILNNNLLKSNRSKQHNFTNGHGPSPLATPVSDFNPEVQFTNLTKINNADSSDQIEMSSIKTSNNNEMHVKNGSNRSSNSNSDNKKMVITFSDVLSEITIDEEESEPKLKSIKQIEECEL